MNTALFGIAAYLIGSISFAVVVSKLKNLADPRTYGSKTPGATNVLRSGNKKAAILTLLGDCAKGWLAVWLAMHYGPEFGLEDSGIALVAIAVFLWHLWPVFFRFSGGKGVATALGILLGLNAWLGIATLITWLVIAYAFRYSSLAALVASIFAPFYYGLLFGPDAKLLALVAMSALLIYRHRKNIGNLISGKKGRIESKKKKKSTEAADAQKQTSQDQLFKRATFQRNSSAQLLQRPARTHVESVVALGRGRVDLQAHGAGKRDHRAIVGAELQLRIKHLEMFFLRGRIQGFAQLPVGADAAGNHQSLQAALLERRHAFRHQDIDDGFDEGARDIRLVLFADIGRVIFHHRQL